MNNRPALFTFTFGSASERASHESWVRFYLPFPEEIFRPGIFRQIGWSGDADLAVFRAFEPQDLLAQQMREAFHTKSCKLVDNHEEPKEEQWAALRLEWKFETTRKSEMKRPEEILAELIGRYGHDVGLQIQRVYENFLARIDIVYETADAAVGPGKRARIQSVEDRAAAEVNFHERHEKLMKDLAALKGEFQAKVAELSNSMDKDDETDAIAALVEQARKNNEKHLPRVIAWIAAARASQKEEG